jgi:3-deoxy-manno-octulosonate cytidylyltransferase (CMP-KDO synthetase)
MTFKVVIPARYASTRLPAKPLADIGGRPMIQWVIDAARRSGAAEVWVATDDDRVAAAAAPFALLTRADHASGTDRIAEVAEQRGWSDDTIVVNVQGDEPQLPAALIDLVASLLATNADAHIATLCTPIAQLREFMDPNAVKVVFDAAGRALYFSRAPIPWNRDAAPQGLSSQTQFEGAYRHLGIYAYRVRALKQLSALPPSSLEQLEKLEQLRALQAGMRIVVAVAPTPPPAGIDTPEDLERVRALLSAQQ